MRPRVRQMRVLAALCSLLLVGGVSVAARGPEQPATGNSERPPRDDRASTTRAAHIRLTGELDTMACVMDLERRLEEAVQDRAGLLILEVSASHARPDVVLAIAEAVRRSEIRTIGFLIDPRDKRVTPAALALALLIGDRVAIDPRTTVRFERGDWRTDLLPEDVDPEEAVEEVRLALERRLAAREIDPTIAATVSPAPDASGSAAIDPNSLPGVGIEVFVSDSATKVARAAGFRGQMPRAVEVETSLEPARARVESLISSADDAIAQSKRTMDLRNQRPDDREISVHDERRAGAAALEILSAAGTSVDRAEVILREFPEILLTPPPGRTDVGTTRLTLRTAWRYRLDDLRKDIRYWTQRANDLVAR